MSRVFLYSYKQNHNTFFSSSLEMKRVFKYLYFCPKFFLFFLTVLGPHLALNFKTNTPSETPTTRLDTEIKLIPVCSARNPNMRRDNVSIAKQVGQAGCRECHKFRINRKSDKNFSCYEKRLRNKYRKE